MAGVWGWMPARDFYDSGFGLRLMIQTSEAEIELWMLE